MDAVDIGAQPSAGLRTPCRDQVPDLEAAQGLGVAWPTGAEQQPRLRENVVGEVIARMVEGLVALGIIGLEGRQLPERGERVIPDCLPRQPTGRRRR